MGSVAKVVKKAAKVIKKPISKITKGIARGIAKVGKSVMKGVGRLSKKLGPLGMIALSIAMPYALSGLSSAIGTSMIGPHGQLIKTGLMAKDGFLGAIGNVGNSIRTGYQAATGAIRTGVGNTWSSITKSIGNGFQKFQTGTGNLWTRISNGAKNLFNSARNQVAKLKKITPKFRQGQMGSVNVAGQTPWGAQYTTMTAEQAGSLIQSGAMDSSNLMGQTLGSPEGWFTKAGSSEADKLITQTINNAMEPQLKMLDKNSLRYFNDHVSFQQGNGSYVNHSQAYDSVINNKGTTRTFATDFAKEPSYTTDLTKTGDYGIGTTQPGKATEYTFTGESTYNNNVGKSAIKNAKKVSNLKKGMKYAAGNMAKSLLTQDSAFKLPEVMYASAADMTHQTTSGTGGTDIKGSWGGSLLRGTFDDNQRERIMNYYKNMNIIGSQSI
jgi:hypothetical protein